MTPARKKYEENQKLMSNYVESHPELKELHDALRKVQKARQNGRCVKLNISIGENDKYGFLVYLRSRIKNPKIMFSSYEGSGNMTPLIIITGDDMPVASFAADKIKIKSSGIETEPSGTGKDNTPYTFDRYSFRFNYDDRFDYDLTMIVYR